MMVFKNAKSPSGNDMPDRWEDEDQEYSIVRYYYWNRYGTTCGPADRCEPWFAAYRNHDGKALAGRNTKLEAFGVAAGYCMDDRAGRTP